MRCRSTIPTDRVVQNVRVVCGSRRPGRADAGPLSAGDSAAHSLRRRYFGGGIYSVPARTGHRAATGSRLLCGSGFAGHACHAHSRAGDCRSEEKSRGAASGGTSVLLRNTRPFNVWGLPAISVPCGFTKSGLPIGLQIAGPHWREDLGAAAGSMLTSVRLWISAAK